MSIKPMVYLCGPIQGLSYADARLGWRHEIRKYITRDIDVLSPMRQEGHLKEVGIISGQPEVYEHPFSRAKAIVAKDRLDVRRSDIVVANLSGAKIVSIGSMVELGWADAYRKPIIVVLGPDDAIHNHVFVHEISNFTVLNIKEAAEVVNMLLMPGV